MLHTAFTDLVGCEAPIQLAGMGSMGTPELAAAVSNAGGLGMVSMVLEPAERVAAGFDSLAKLTSGPVGINFLMPFIDQAAVEAASTRCRLVEFFYDDPVPALVDTAHQGGALACWQVGSLEEALAAVDAGCDLIAVQGNEAGGHVRGTVSLLPLLDAVLDAVDVPVVAAGGIATARGVAAVLAAGAAGARLGTRFLASTESDAHPDYVQAMLDASAGDTAVTTAFDVLWPNAPHRVLRSCIAAAGDLETDVVAEIPGQAGPTQLPRFTPLPPTRATTGHTEAMALYAGESVGLVHEVKPAGDIVRELVNGAEKLLAAKRS
jgi:NAD(P)H-dependent flavin oxidoreductase YrpB (nitropropane dioxygenase family)